jgi:2-methylcitrate dehydratase PrpD
VNATETITGTRQVAEFIVRTDFNSLLEDVVAQAQTAIRDHVGAMLAAREDAAVCAAAKVAAGGGGRAESTLISTGQRVPAAMAAMANAIMASTLDADDGAYRPTGHMGHAGGVVVPGALAVAEREHASGKDLITAVVIGYEVALRVGWLSYLGGAYAPAGMVGNFGAAALAAKLIGLDVTQTAHALGIAEAHCLHPSRAKDYMHMTMTKEASGWGAFTGVSAALLAQAGFEGPETVFDMPENDPEPLAGLGREWEIRRLYFKPYSLCRYSHAPIDGLLAIMRQNGLSTGDVSRVEVGTAVPAVNGMVNYRPQNTWEAQFSIPYAVGVALAEGMVLPAQIAGERLKDDVILDQADKISVVVDPEADALRPGMVAARITVETTAGGRFTTFIPDPLGSPENPLGEAALRRKFDALTEPTLGPDRSERLYARLSDLTAVADITTLVEEFQPSIR